MCLTALEGEPDEARIDPSFVERSSLSPRMRNHRFIWLTNAFSKEFGNHTQMVSLYTVSYNLVRIHKNLRVMLVIQAGLTDKIPV